MTFNEWRLRTRRLGNSDHTLIMGVVNVTPDSFSDGGDFADATEAIAHGRRLAAQGADIVDIGGESTRPGSDEVSVDEEIDRAMPVVKALSDDGIIVSIDTSKAVVAEQALEGGAEIVNDVSALRDPDMAGLVASTGAGVVLMHMRGTPSTMQLDPRYDDVVIEVRDELLATARTAESLGVAGDQICLDPGIGFGKTVAHNLTLLRMLSRITEAGYPTLLGTSRKSFLGSIAGIPDAKDRDVATAATTALAVASGVFCVRVHDVPRNLQSARIADAIVRASISDEDLR